MIPLYISGCFSVLHPGQGKRGALICGPLSDEALNAYRPLVFLAEDLAAAGISALRMTCHGTGDSAGDDDQPDRFNQWLHSIAAGVAWLRQHHGIEAVTLIGHRIGASLVARAACDIDEVDSLVLLSPIGGRQFLHEMTLAARISQRVWQTTHKVDDGTWFESHGLRIDHVTRDALNSLDIRRLPSRPAAQALVLEADSRPAVLALVESLRRAGTEATFEPCDGLDRMQHDSHSAAVPHAAFDRIVRWVRSRPGVSDTPCTADAVGEASLDAGPAREVPIRFGPHQALFGILSQPAWPSADAPAVLLVNTSANPRWGNARVAVDLARGLAADGVTSLRMDASGMGDAAPSTGEVGRPYAEATTRDTLHAVQELALRTQRPVVVLGVCSGAYHALQAACRDPLVGGVVLVNLQRFVWREGDPPDAVRRTDLRPTRFYLRNILSAQAWVRLFHADFDVANLLRVLAARMLRRTLAGMDPFLNLLPGNPTRVGKVRRSVRMLSVPILYVLGRNDPGVEELAEYFGQDGWRLRRQPNVTIRVLEGADHTLGAHPLRAALIQDIRDWCRDNWPPRNALPRNTTAHQRSAAGRSQGRRRGAPILVRSRRNAARPVNG